MITVECIDELADYVGLKAEVSEVTERAMRGELAFEPALRERVALLKGLPVGVVDEIIEPTASRGALARAIAAAPRRRGDHGNIPL